MNFGPTLFLGAFLTFAFAWMGLVFFPTHQLGHLKPQVVEGSTDVNPRPYSGLESRGRQVYIANGCIYCHSQQLRGGDWNADLNRGWGPRRSVPQDYINDDPVMLGSMRTGPDLINIGARQPSDDWHLKHLYSPQTVSPGSNMPPFPFLFEKRKIVGQPSADALNIKSIEPGYELVPTDDAKALVAYLKSLDRTYDVPGLPTN
jgi:cytochrome c oxidase cbb3-type subunit 2